MIALLRAHYFMVLLAPFTALVVGLLTGGPAFAGLAGFAVFYMQLDHYGDSSE